MIRLAEFKDVQGIAQTHIQAWIETYQGIVHEQILKNLRVDQKLKIWEIIVSDPHHTLWVYEENQHIVGFIDGYFPENSEVAEIRAFYLLKKVQRKGNGSALFSIIKNIAQSKHYKKLSLEVFDKNSSRIFYEKKGGKVQSVQDASDYCRLWSIIEYCSLHV